MKFLYFPKSLLVCLLSEWCYLKSLIIFDAAICNKDCRLLLDTLYETISFTIPEYKVRQKNATNVVNSIFNWFSVRKIKLCHLTVDGKIMSDLNQLLSSLDKSKLTSLTFKNYNKGKEVSTNFKLFVNSCRALNAIDFIGMYSVDKVLLEIEPLILKQLNTVSSRDNTLQPNTFEHLATHCCSLVVFNLKLGSGGEFDLSKLVRNNRNLQSTCCGTVSANLTLIDALCALPNLRVFACKSSNITIRDGLRLHHTFPDIEELNLGEHFAYVNRVVNGEPTKVLALSNDGQHLHNITESELLSVFEQVTGLHSIGLSDFQHLTDSVLEVVAANNPDLAHILLGWRDKTVPAQYTSEGVKKLFYWGNKIRYFALDGNNHLSNDQLIDIFNSSHTMLHFIQLRDHRTVDAPTLVTILKAQPKLREMNNFRCQGLAGIPEVSKQFCMVDIFWRQVSLGALQYLLFLQSNSDKVLTVNYGL